MNKELSSFLVSLHRDFRVARGGEEHAGLGQARSIKSVSRQSSPKPLDPCLDLVPWCRAQHCCA